MDFSESRGGRKRRRRLYERRIRLMSMLLAFPGAAVATVFLLLQPWSSELRYTAVGALWLATLIIELYLHEQVIRPLQTLANVVASLREEDYSFRARGASTDDALGELALEVNALADTLATSHTGMAEAAELLRRVVEEIDSPLFTFDPANRLKLVNAAGASLLQSAPENLIGRSAEEIGLEPYLKCSTAVTTPNPLGGGARWMVRRRSFREKGVPHTLVVLSDVSRALREEERVAWQRLVRVLGHELNNSLTPIKSIAGTLLQRVESVELSADDRRDFQKGLGIVEARAASLNRFLQAYRQLAQIPSPVLKKLPLRTLLERIAALETRLRVEVRRGPEMEISVDPDLFEQMLINLVRNAADAALEATPHSPRVSICWRTDPFVLEVVDNGLGLLNQENAFVPFYTTKAGGSGIGLVLSRQIAEAHGGTLTLVNRNGDGGCIARLVLPIVR